MASSLTPPHSDEAEQAVIGALLLDNGTLDRIPHLEAEHFYRSEYRAVFSTVRSMIVANKTADVLTVADRGVMTSEDLHALAMSVPSSAHAPRYAEIVIERSIERELQRIGGEISESADAAGVGAIDKVDAAMSKLTALANLKQTTESVGIAEAVVAFIDRLSAEAEGKTQVISTGLRALDRMLAGGLRRGELMVVGARPKMGKTALTLALARNMATSHGVLILSQEMPVYELVSRHAAALGSINLADMRRPSEMPDKAWTGITDAVEAMKAMAMMMDDQRGLTLIDVRRKVMEAKRKMGCDVVIVDFLQLMVGDSGKEANRNQELDRISNGLKAMAGEFGVAVILLSQLSREADKRHGPPIMTDLRDCGAIEAAADIIAMLYREFAHPLGSKAEEWKHHAQLEIVQRNGAPGTIPLWFSGEYQQFSDWTGPAPYRAEGRKSSVRSKGLD